jgi:hypothetical protein
MESSSVENLFLFVCCAFLMGFFHKGLLVFVFFLVGTVIFLPLPIKPNKLKSPFIYIVLAIGVMMFLYFSISSLNLTGMSTVKAALDGDALSYIHTYRENVNIGRTSYHPEIAIESISGLIFSLPIFVFYYLFTPFPLGIKSSLDAYAFVEVMIRAILILSSCVLILINNRRANNGFVVLIALFFGSAGLWALGTTNYGTAIRHNVTHFWIICILGVPILYNLLIRMINHSIKR